MLALRRFAPLAAAVAVAVVAGGCGSSNDLPQDIPPANASGLISNLNTVLADCQQGDPAGAKSQAAQYERAVALLPDSVDPDTRKILEETATNLTKLTGEQSGCGSGTTGTSGLQGAQPTTTTTTTTAEATATTSPTTTAESDTTSPETQPPPETPAGGNDQGSNGQGPSGEGQGGGGPTGNGSGTGGGVTPDKAKGKSKHGDKAKKHEGVGH
jgi:hypothetical protein